MNYTHRQWQARNAGESRGLDHWVIYSRLQRAWRHWPEDDCGKWPWPLR